MTFGRSDSRPFVFHPALTLLYLASASDYLLIRQGIQNSETSEERLQVQEVVSDSIEIS